MPPSVKSTSVMRPVNPQDPSTWLKPDESLIGADGRDWSWAYVWFKDIDDDPGYRIGYDGSAWTCLVRRRLRNSPEGRSFAPGSTWKKLAVVRHSRGYVKVNIYGHSRLLHHLVLEAFFGPRPPKMQGRHLNGNRADCRGRNLAWGTVRENHRDKIRHGSQPMGERHWAAIFSEEDILEMRRRWDSGESVPSITQSFQANDGTVRDIVKRRTWKHMQ